MRLEIDGGKLNFDSVDGVKSQTTFMCWFILVIALFISLITWFYFNESLIATFIIFGLYFYVVRGGSVCLNRIRCFRKWISAVVMPPPRLASAH